MRSALNASVVWKLTTEGERPFHCGIVRGKWVLQGITVCLLSTILGTVWCLGGFQTVSRGQVLVCFYRHSSRMYLMKEKQGGPIPTGLKRWPLKLIKHLAETSDTHVRFACHIKTSTLHTTDLVLLSSLFYIHGSLSWSYLAEMLK